MKLTGSKGHKIVPNLLWFAVVGTAAAAVVPAAFLVSQYQFSKSVVLLLALFLAVLLSQYELRLPKTSIEISVSDIIAVWGVFWLGVSGGVLLGAAASVSRYMRDRELSYSNVYLICSNVIGVALAAIAFSFGFRFSLFDGKNITSFEDLNIIVGGTLLMTSVSFAIFSLLDHSYRILRRIPFPRRSVLLTRLLELLPTSLITITLSSLFAYFGLEFGLVVGPICILGTIAYRIHLSRLEQKTAQILEASRIQMATVEALATAIDAREQISSGHVRRTQVFAVGIGKAMGLSESDMSALRAGALLHDIGKLAVPDHILSKPGSLTEAELEKIKIHASVGASILEEVGFDYPVVPTVRHHHESWDGTGYPDGLSSVHIPLTARVLAVADTYDTLRSSMPFQSRISRGEARELMIEKAGKQLDPHIVNVFLRRVSVLEDELVALGLSYSDAWTEPTPPSGNYVEQIKLANREVFALYELAMEFGSSASLEGMLGVFTDRIKQLIPFDTCTVFLLDHSKRFAYAAHVYGVNQQVLSARRIKIGEGATGVSLKKRQMVKNVNPDLDFSLSQLEMIQQYSTMAAMPLIVDDELIGAISIYSVDLEKYEDEHLRLLETVSRIASEAIGKSQQHAEAQANALTDPMTGLPNARSLQLQFHKEVGRASRAGSTFQLLVLDLDGFKAVNDDFGHLAGDEMLRHVSEVIRQQLRDYDFLSRYGGDEFVALIPEAGHEDVAELCSRIEHAVSEFRLPVDGDRFASVGVSIGAVQYSEGGTTFQEMIVAADKAMYSSKSSRKKNEAFARMTRTAPLSELLTGAFEGEFALSQSLDLNSDEGFIVELDESHVITLASIN